MNELSIGGSGPWKAWYDSTGQIKCEQKEFLLGYFTRPDTRSSCRAGHNRFQHHAQRLPSLFDEHSQFRQGNQGTGEEGQRQYFKCGLGHSERYFHLMH